MEDKYTESNNLQTIPENNKLDKTAEEREAEIRPLNAKNYEDEIDLGDLFMYLRSKLIFLCLALIGGAVVGFAITKYLITPTYQASSYLYMLSSSSKSVIDINAFNMGTSAASDYQQLLVRLPVLENVAEEIDQIEIINKDTELTSSDETILYKIKRKLSRFTNEDPNIINGKMYLGNAQQLAGYISFSVLSDSRIMKITVTTTDPLLCKKIANKLAEQAVSYIPEITAAPAPTIAERAVLPRSKYKPNYSKNIEVGGLLGLIIVGLIFIVKYLRDDSIKDAEDMERIFGITPLTVIPEGKIENVSHKYNSRKKRIEASKYE